MNYIDFISAIGIGAIVVKILDIVWLQRLVSNNEKNKWKRDKKIIIYSKIARDLVSQEEWGNPKRTLKFNSLIGEALLVIENNILRKKLEDFYTDSLYSLHKSSGIRQLAEHYGDEGLDEKAKEFRITENQRLQVEAREILRLLKNDLLS